ncbi:YisL family protein, partial [Staphylococcus aureus]
SHTMFWITIALIIITMVLGVILPLGPLSKLFGIG